MTLPIEILTLRQLEIGDRFIAVSDKKRLSRFLVKGNSLFNRGHGSSTRTCILLNDNSEVSKSCNLKVIKIGESQHKDKMQKLYGVPKR